jgi:hypothetical protein
LNSSKETVKRNENKPKLGEIFATYKTAKYFSEYTKKCKPIRTNQTIL